jgi:hypothetical protein
MRVRASSQPGVGTGFVQTIDNSSGHRTRLVFDARCPARSRRRRVEIHSGQYAQEGSRGRRGSGRRLVGAPHRASAIPPSASAAVISVARGRSGCRRASPIARRATDTQAKLKSRSRSRTRRERRQELIDQLSFIMGGATVEIGGQIVFRQIYPLRDANGQVVVAGRADRRDVRRRATPSGSEHADGLEQRITQLACDYGVEHDGGRRRYTPAALTTNFVDVDALAWLDDQPVDELAPRRSRTRSRAGATTRPTAGVSRGDAHAAGRARREHRASRVAVERDRARPQLVVGDRVAVITDQYTDYDPVARSCRSAAGSRTRWCS